MTPRFLLGALASLPFAAPALAVTVQVPLNYNYNGIVHAGESGSPDAADGYRSISDRGLDFTAGVPSSALLDPYSLVGTTGSLDIVYLGNRNTVDVGGVGGGAFDATADGDNIGTQPSWLADPDQTGPQTTVLPVSIVLDATSSASIIYQISNGGGSFDVVFGFQGGGTFTDTLSGADWFNGDYAGTAGIDSGNTGANNLKIEEGTVDLSAFDGSVLESITFQNRSNANAGYAILAANVEGTPVPESSTALIGAVGALLLLRRRRVG